MLQSDIINFYSYSINEENTIGEIIKSINWNSKSSNLEFEIIILMMHKDETINEIKNNDKRIKLFVNIKILKVSEKE